jgi:hypothetical protein
VKREAGDAERPVQSSFTPFFPQWALTAPPSRRKLKEPVPTEDAIMLVAPTQESKMQVFTTKGLINDLNDLNRQYQAAFRQAEGSDFQLTVQAASAVAVINIELNSMQALTMRTLDAVQQANDQLDYDVEGKLATQGILNDLRSMRDAMALVQTINDRIKDTFDHMVD